MQEWINLLIQVPLVAAFMWFVLKMLEHQQKATDKRDEEWRKFLEEQGRQYSEGLKELAQTVKELSAHMQEHDEAMRGAVSRMNGVVSERAKKRDSE